MGLLRTRNETASIARVEDLPFAASGADENLRTAAIGEAVAWFLQRGYVPSIPVEPTRYDLVVESDDGLKRVQVKSTTSTERDRWLVRIARKGYEAGGQRGRRVYDEDDIDLLFIVTSSGDKYLVPIGITGGAASLTLDSKYAAYKVEDYRSAGRERLRRQSLGWAVRGCQLRHQRLRAATGI